ncbi:hypothetical protein C8R44DRAFT_728182 [Mycena epipterygia]|nr:hypothetical protein C8R44DRAFT_728182 [Mycena epipterygia]
MASVSSAWAIFGLPTTLAQVSSPTAFSRSLINFKQLEVYKPVCAGRRADDAILWLTFSLAMIGVFGKWDARLQIALGTFKFDILAGIALLGLLSLVGVSRFVIRPADKTPHNFASWATLWSGSRSDPNSLVLTRGRSFIGYSNANYALPEVKDPVRTIKRAAPLAIQSVSAVYMLVNIAYFSIVADPGTPPRGHLPLLRLLREQQALLRTARHALRYLRHDGHRAPAGRRVPLPPEHVLVLHMTGYMLWARDLPFRVPRVVVALFFAASVFLALAPLLPPALSQKMFKHIPYYMHFVVTLAASQLGVHWSTSTRDSDQTAPPGDVPHFRLRASPLCQLFLHLRIAIKQSPPITSPSWQLRCFSDLFHFMITTTLSSVNTTDELHLRDSMIR